MENLVQPNSETKIYLSNNGYDILNKRVEYSDQLCCAVHPSLCIKDGKGQRELHPYAEAPNTDKKIIIANNSFVSQGSQPPHNILEQL